MSEKKYIVTADEAYKLHSIIEYPDEWTLPGGEADMWLKEHEYRERTCYMNDCDAEGYTVPESIWGDGFCSACDGIIDVEDRYCRHCGAKVM